MKKQFATLKRRGLSAFLALALCMSLVQVNAFALEPEGDSTQAGSNETPQVEVFVTDPGNGGDETPVSSEIGNETDTPTQKSVDTNKSDNGETATVSEGQDAEEENGTDAVTGNDQNTPEDSSTPDAAPNESGEEEEELEPGQVKVEETLNEMTKVPDGYGEQEDGTYSKTEPGETVEYTGQDKLTHTQQTSTEYEWTKEPIADENGRLTGYKTTVHSTTTTIDTCVSNTYTAKPNQNGLNNLDKQLLKNERLDSVSHEVSEWSEDGKALVYTRIGERTDPVTGVVTRIVQEFNANEGTKKETVTILAPKRVVKENVVSIQQNEDGTITYKPSVSDNSSVPTTSITPDISSNTSLKQHLIKRPDETVSYVDKNFLYQWMGEYGPCSMIPIQPEGINGDSKYYKWSLAGLVILRDDEGNAHYVYCADMQTPEVPGTKYTLENLEDELKENGGYILSSEDAAMVQSIALNGYWGTESGIGSLDKVKELLKQSNKDVDVEELTPGLALAATQAAIWYYTNGGEGGLNKDEPFSLKFLLSGSTKLPLSEPSRYTDEDKAVLQALYECLISTPLNEEQRTTTDIISSSDIENATISVKDLAEEATVDKAAIYNADVSFILNVEPERMFSTDLKVSLYNPLNPGEVIAEYKLDPENSGAEGCAKYDPDTKTYILENVKLANGATVTLRLSGTQMVQQNAYLITASTGPASSQTFVSVEEGKRDVDLTLDLHFSIKDKTPDPEDPTPTPTPDPDPTPTPDPDEPDVPDPDVPLVPGPDPEEPPVDIPEEDPPLVDIPEPPLVDVPDPDVPLAPRPSTPNQPVPGVDIPDEDVPLADVPNTGDGTGLWCTLGLMAGAGLVYLFLEEKKRQNNAK